MAGRILIVDDEDLFRLCLGINLKKQGYEVDKARDGQEGLDVLKAVEGIGLVLCDRNMPGMDGYEFCKNVRMNLAVARYSQLPIIGIGSFSENEKDLLTDGLNFPKPFEISEIQNAVRRYLP